MSKTIKIGSRVFFDNISDYIPKDEDFMAIQNIWLPKNRHVLNLKRDGKDIFFWSPLSKEEFIQDTIDSNVPMRVGKFLVPEFCEYIGFEISDYEKLSDMFDNLDEKHRYEIIIRDAYIENNGFFLTDEQRLKAYEEYKRERPDRYTQT